MKYFTKVQGKEWTGGEVTSGISITNNYSTFVDAQNEEVKIQKLLGTSGTFFFLNV